MVGGNSRGSVIEGPIRVGHLEPPAVHVCNRSLNERVAGHREPCSSSQALGPNFGRRERYERMNRRGSMMVAQCAQSEAAGHVRYYRSIIRRDGRSNASHSMVWHGDHEEIGAVEGPGNIVGAAQQAHDIPPGTAQRHRRVLAKAHIQW